MYDPIPQPNTTGGVNVNVMGAANPQQPFNNLLNNPLLQPRTQVRQVANDKEIYALPMGFKSSEFILSSTEPLIYYVETDDNGNKVKIIPFDIQMHVTEPEPTMQDVKAIETRFEEKFNNFKDEITNLISTKIEEALK